MSKRRPWPPYITLSLIHSLALRRCTPQNGDIPAGIERERGKGLGSWCVLSPCCNSDCHTERTQLCPFVSFHQPLPSRPLNFLYSLSFTTSNSMPMLVIYCCATNYHALVASDSTHSLSQVSMVGNLDTT